MSIGSSTVGLAWRSGDQAFEVQFGLPGRKSQPNTQGSLNSMSCTLRVMRSPASISGLKMTRSGTIPFRVLRCKQLPQLTIVDRYVTAWTSGDPDQIAALDDDNATFTDSLLRIDAVGPEEISGIR